jgi:hypothetical protein
VAVRTRGAGTKQDVMAVGNFVAKIREEVASRALGPGLA